MEKVECIVVGGGLAGLAAAYGLARGGVEVMVLERGNYSGAKNVTGGRLYVRPLRAHLPRAVGRGAVRAPGRPRAGHDARRRRRHHGRARLRAPRRAAQPQTYTVQRARLDQWLADKATEAGAMVVTDMKADELLRDGDRVIGVRAGDDEVGAEVTIVAEGVLRLARRRGAGWRESPSRADHAVGFKEVIELPAGVIEDRWRLNEGEGAAQLFMGEVTPRHDRRRLSVHQPRHRSRWAWWSPWSQLRTPQPTASRAGSCSTSSRRPPRSGRWCAAARSPSTRRTPSPRAASDRCRGLAGDGYLLAGDAAGFA